MSEVAAGVMPPAEWNGARTEYPDDCSVAVLFSRSVASAPGAVAVVDGGRQVSYAELAAWSDRLAARLVAVGVQVGEAVAVLGERCLEAPAAMVGILKAGGVYVPLSPTDPPGRLRVLVDELRLRWMVRLPGTSGVLGDVPSVNVEEFRAGAPVAWEAVTVGGDAAVYILFTSGSTGAPKAVAVPHRAVARLVIQSDYLRLEPADRVSNTGQLTFDASVFEIWGALLNGARVVVVDPDILLDPDRLRVLWSAAGVTVAWLSAGIFHHCARLRPDMFADLRCLIVGGDVLIPELVRRVLDHGAPRALLNGYGPTENTTFSATHRITDLDEGGRVPIGRPIANSTCYILDAKGIPTAVGDEGELWVGGDGVALGYVNSPELTAQRFVTDPAGHRPGARLFRTGDRARWLPDGSIDFLGRSDRMVKIRDYRIELDEIEAALGQCPGVSVAAVVVEGEGPRRAVVAYYVPEPLPGGRAPEDSWSVGSVRGFLVERLPHFMIPARLVPRDQLPLSVTGKVDRAALSGVAKERSAITRDAGSGLLRTPLEVGLARLWAEVLDVDEVSPEDSFFALGGNSLSAARVFTRLRTMFGVDIGQARFLTARLLADPSLAACAEAVAVARRGTLTQHETGAEVDFARESRLDVPVAATPLGRTAGNVRSGAILLTGATGFVGAHLLRRLLAATGGPIYCLVRAGDPDQAQARLAAAQARYQLGELRSDRVIPLVGDLSQPLLGLPAGEFDRLAATLGLIVHAASYVNFTYPYAHLAGVTVAGVKEVIRLAGRYGGIPVHHVSTLAVLAGFGAAGIREVSEDTPLGFPEHLYMGYTEAKWVAEALLAQAADAGLPVSIYRPYEVSGDLSHGAWNLENATCALFRLIVDAGIAPEVDLPLDLMPVDVLATQITQLALTRPTDPCTYHLANPRPAMLADLVRLLRRRGYRIRSLPFDQWVSGAVGYVCDHPEHPFTPFIPLWVDRSPRSGLVVKEMFFASHFPRFSRTHTDQALAGTGVRVPPVDDDLLDRYVQFFQRVGFFPPPPGRPSATEPR